MQWNTALARYIQIATSIQWHILRCSVLPSNALTAVVVIRVTWGSSVVEGFSLEENVCLNWTNYIKTTTLENSLECKECNKCNVAQCKRSGILSIHIPFQTFVLELRSNLHVHVMLCVLTSALLHLTCYISFRYCGFCLKQKATWGNGACDWMRIRVKSQGKT